jgi:endonuclease/exonuclease/phosphatase (EEP) superfamily protein YafD
MFRRICQIAIWLYICGIAVWLMIGAVRTDYLWYVTLADKFALYALLPVFALLGLALWQRRWAALVGLLLPLGVFAIWFGPLFVPRVPVVQPTAPHLTVMTYNMLWTNQNAPQIRAMLLASNADVVGLQEVRPEFAPLLADALKDAYPYSAFHPNDEFHNVGVLSRFPLEQVQVLPSRPIERALQAEIEFDGRPVTIIVAHLTPNYKAAEGMRTQLNHGIASRQEEVDYLRRLVAQRTIPTVLLCDCNMTDLSSTYQQLRGELHDSWREVGWGLGHTGLLAELGDLPWTRIDYVWHTSELRAVAAQVGVAAGSDHLPVIVRLQVRGEL